jgi:tight adherence protein C
VRDASRVKRRIRSIAADRSRLIGGDGKAAPGPKAPSPRRVGVEAVPLKSKAGDQGAAGSGGARAPQRSGLAQPRWYLAILSGLAALLIQYHLSDNQLYLILVPTLAAMVPLVAAPLYHSRQVTARRRGIERQVPDALDLLVVCTEAGLSLDSSIQRIGKELAMTAPELAHELSVTSAELSLLPDRRAAITNLAKRTESPSLRVLTTALVQTERYGTPVAQALRILSAEMRDQRMLRAEAKAARLPAVMTIPLIVFILPTLFVVIIGPALLQIYDILGARGG